MNKRNILTPAARPAFSFTIAGIIFGDSRFLGYSLIGIGIVLALIDIFIRSKTTTK